MNTKFYNLRSTINDKAKRYFYFDISRWNKVRREMFFGATDALLDSCTAAEDYARALEYESRSVGHGLLVCYGFLQALYIQQDAVRILSRSVGLDWNPEDNDELKSIRMIRNRITGHPAYTERHTPKSSAIIRYDSITTNGFEAHLFLENGFEKIDVNAMKFLEKNVDALTAQLEIIDQEMDGLENRLRAEERKRSIGDALDKSDYLVRRLWCDLGDYNRVLQAISHAKILNEILGELRSELIGRNFKDADEQTIQRIKTGISELHRRLTLRECSGTFSLNDQHLFDLIHSGIEDEITKLKKFLTELNSELNTIVSGNGSD